MSQTSPSVLDPKLDSVTPPPMLQVSGLNVYYGESHILRDVDLAVPQGKMICLIGRNGVGKTTLLKTVMGLLPARSGSIQLAGESVIKLSPDQRARLGIGYVPQGREIIPRLTVKENLLLGLEARSQKSRRLTANNIPADIFELFPVLRTMLSRMGGDLSGGQQQQLAIARALMGRPQLLALDEPTEGIQPSIIKDIERVIRHLAAKGDMAIVLVEQYFEFARDLADTFMVMDRGEVVMAGTRDEMIEDHVRRYLTV